MIIRHLDGNSLNNNLNNLKYGTYKENYNDSVRHGTNQIGIRNPRAVLSEEDVQDIRLRLSIGELQKNIAKKYGVNTATIFSIKNKRNWGWLKNIHNEKIYLPRGSRMGSSKLKEEDIFKIRPRINNGESLVAIAKDFGVTHSTISDIKLGITWSWLKEPVKELAAV
jgi:DNA invertase Pin-like site-specific DNA recombinase